MSTNEPSTPQPIEGPTFCFEEQDCGCLLHRYVLPRKDNTGMDVTLDPIVICERIYVATACDRRHVIGIFLDFDEMSHSPGVSAREILDQIWLLTQLLQIVAEDAFGKAMLDTAGAIRDSVRELNVQNVKKGMDLPAVLEKPVYFGDIPFTCVYCGCSTTCSYRDVDGKEYDRCPACGKIQPKPETPKKEPRYVDLSGHAKATSSLKQRLVQEHEAVEIKQENAGKDMAADMDDAQLNAMFEGGYWYDFHRQRSNDPEYKAGERIELVDPKSGEGVEALIYHPQSGWIVTLSHRPDGTPNLDPATGIVATDQRYQALNVIFVDRKYQDKATPELIAYCDELNRRFSDGQSDSPALDVPPTSELDDLN